MIRQGPSRAQRRQAPAPPRANARAPSCVYQGVERALTLGRADEDDAHAETRADRLEALFASHQQGLYRLARRMSRDPEEARDLVQEAFLRLARSWSRLPADGPGAERWLVRTVVNLCHDRWRRRSVREAHIGDAAASAPACAPGPDPEATAVARATVAAALARLSPRRRAIVVLHELEGRSVADVARLLGAASVTIRWHLAAARRELRRVIEGEASRA